MRLAGLIITLAVCGLAASGPASEKTKRPNILVVLTDDHRYDAMGFLGHPFLKTPYLDALAANGVHFRNAFVTTSLCSPSRASILTGLHAHNHRVVDNYNPIPEGLTFFPEYLQESGYATAFVGKWHMGGMIDDPQPGFDYWLSFKGQGVYYPDPSDSRVKGRYVPQVSRGGLNLNGERIPQNGYLTDVLTEFALAWLRSQHAASPGRPWLLFLSHKAAHADFLPANRHAYAYQDEAWEAPESWFEKPKAVRDVPRWVQNQRNSRHGVEFAYYTDLDLGAYYRRYSETLLAVDEGLGKLVQQLRATGELTNTLILYLGDNGFLFGEHGLIDKRCAYQESIRIPMLLAWPAEISSGQTVDQIVANIDVGPTLLDAAGLTPPATMDGMSFLPLARGEPVEWRDYLLYEYYWERNYPQTPTMHAVVGRRYKYVRYHGIWDVDQLFDTQADPHENVNLIHDPAHSETVALLNQRLFDMLKRTEGTEMPILPDRGTQFFHRKANGSTSAPFPDWFYRRPDSKPPATQR